MDLSVADLSLDVFVSPCGVAALRPRASDRPPMGLQFSRRPLPLLFLSLSPLFYFLGVFLSFVFYLAVEVLISTIVFLTLQSSVLFSEFSFDMASFLCSIVAVTFLISLKTVIIV